MVLIGAVLIDVEKKMFIITVVQSPCIMQNLYNNFLSTLLYFLLWPFLVIKNCSFIHQRPFKIGGT